MAQFLGIPTPTSLFYDRLNDLFVRYHRLMIKPTDSSSGNGVTTNVFNIESFQEAIKMAKQYSFNIAIRLFIGGNEYRIHSVLSANKNL